MGIWTAEYQQNGPGRLGDRLVNELVTGPWKSFRAAVAFAKRSGVKHLAGPLHGFSRRHDTRVQLTIGISNQGTSLEAVEDVWRVLEGHGDFYLFHEGGGQPISFHPKLYLFENADEALAIIGSTNLTEGGLFTNHEVSAVGQLNAVDDSATLASLHQALDLWQTPGPCCMTVDTAILQQLHDQGDLPSEAQVRAANVASRRATRRTRTSDDRPGSPIRFGSSGAASAPTPSPFPTDVPDAAVVVRAVEDPDDGPEPDAEAHPSDSSTSTPGGAGSATTSGRGESATGSTPSRLLDRRQFAIEVRPHHNGEVFLSYRAVQERPDFFKYPFTGSSVPRAGGRSYPAMDPDPTVELVIYDTSSTVLHHIPSHPLNVVDYEPKREIRLTVPDGLQRSIPQMSVLVITEQPTAHLDFRLEFWPPGSRGASDYAAVLTTALPTGGAPVARHYGWTITQV